MTVTWQQTYGPDNVDIFRRVASHVDRILRGANPAELPVQVPIKFETVINLKTAKAPGLTVPLTLQVAAAEVIEWGPTYAACRVGSVIELWRDTRAGASSGK
jgi:hypothetical protein